MTASTARIIGRESSWGRARRLVAASRARYGRFRCDGDLGELELGPAAGAERVVQRDDLPAARALAAQLVAVGAVEHEREQPEDRQDRRDQEAAGSSRRP